MAQQLQKLLTQFKTLTQRIGWQQSLISSLLPGFTNFNIKIGKSSKIIVHSFEVCNIFEAAGIVKKICLSLKLTHDKQVKLVQILDMHSNVELVKSSF